MATSGGLGRVEALLDALEAQADPDTLAAVRELVALLLDAHGEGLATILATARARGADVAAALLDDPLVVDLLLLHGLHPQPPRERAERALARLRRDLGAIGDGLALIRVDEDVLEVSLPGVTAEIADIVIRRLEREVPDAGTVVIAELPVRHLLPVVPAGPT